MRKVLALVAAACLALSTISLTGCQPSNGSNPNDNGSMNGSSGGTSGSSTGMSSPGSGS